jgi:hypothetical protein
MSPHLTSTLKETDHGLGRHIDTVSAEDGVILSKVSVNRRNAEMCPTLTERPATLCQHHPLQLRTFPCERLNPLPIPEILH